MPITATFDKLEFNNVAGYLISMCMTPNQGFQGHFYVYLYDTGDPQYKLQPVDIHDDGPTPRGTLQIVGDQRSYKFENLDMTVVEAGMTRRERFRLVEFRYAPDISDKVKLPAELDNTSGVNLAQSGFQDDYKFNLGDGGEDLLGFRARLSARDAILLRLSSLRNTTNSWVKKIVEVNNEQVTKTGTDRFMPSFEIALGFSPDKLQVTKDNLVRLFVQEAYGDALKWRQPTLTDYITGSSGPELARLNPDALTPQTLVEHEEQTGFTPSAGSKTIETATFLFKAQQYRNLPIC
jgi:hypothetical protein